MFVSPARSKPSSRQRREAHLGRPLLRDTCRRAETAGGRRRRDRTDGARRAVRPRSGRASDRATRMKESSTSALPSATHLGELPERDALVVLASARRDRRCRSARPASFSAARATSRRRSFIVAVASAWISPSSSRSSYSSSTASFAWALRKRHAPPRGTRCGSRAARSAPRPAGGRARARAGRARTTSAAGGGARARRRRCSSSSRSRRWSSCSRVKRSAYSRDDRRRLGALFLADTDGSRLLGPLRTRTCEARLEVARACERWRSPRRGIYTGLDIIGCGRDVRGGHPGAVRHSARRAVERPHGRAHPPRAHRSRARRAGRGHARGAARAPVLAPPGRRGDPGDLRRFRRSAEAHRELAAALEDARDVTGDVACLLELDDYGGRRRARARVARGALPRAARDAAGWSACRRRCRPSSRSRRRQRWRRWRSRCWRRARSRFLAGAVLVIWPLWAAGLALVAASLLVYRP